VNKREANCAALAAVLFTILTENLRLYFSSLLLFEEKIKHMLSIRASLNFHYGLNFFFKFN